MLRHIRQSWKNMEAVQQGMERVTLIASAVLHQAGNDDLVPSAFGLLPVTDVNGLLLLLLVVEELCWVAFPFVGPACSWTGCACASIEEPFCHRYRRAVTPVAIRSRTAVITSIRMSPAARPAVGLSSSPASGSPSLRPDTVLAPPRRIDDSIPAQHVSWFFCRVQTLASKKRYIANGYSKLSRCYINWNGLCQFSWLRRKAVQCEVFGTAALTILITSRLSFKLRSSQLLSMKSQHP
jgi:hypothetical protein